MKGQTVKKLLVLVLAFEEKRDWLQKLYFLDCRRLKCLPIFYCFKLKPKSRMHIFVELCWFDIHKKWWQNWIGFFPLFFFCKILNQKDQKSIFAPRKISSNYYYYFLTPYHVKCVKANLIREFLLSQIKYLLDRRIVMTMIIIQEIYPLLFTCSLSDND